MTIRTIITGGGLSGALGALLGGAVALAQGNGEAVWLYSLIAAGVASLLGWVVARRRFA